MAKLFEFKKPTQPKSKAAPPKDRKQKRPKIEEAKLEVDEALEKRRARQGGKNYKDLEEDEIEAQKYFDN